MLGYKGLCEWKLIEDDKVVNEGKQWNTASEAFLRLMCLGSAGGGIVKLADPITRIQLSDTLPSPSTNYKIDGASNGFNILSETGNLTEVPDFTLNSVYVTNNFSPPGTSRTIRVIGIEILDASQVSFQNFISFIELSTPITQTTTQFLYVKYTMFYTYSSGGNNIPANHFIEYGVTKGMLDGAPLLFAACDSGKYARFYVTGFLEPDSTNNLMRMPASRYSSSGTCPFGSNYGTSKARVWGASFSTSTLAGPIGATVYGNFYGQEATPRPAGAGYWMYYVNGYSPIDDLGPGISRVFVHPAGNNAIYSDPTIADSQGIMSTDGTPTNTTSIILRATITKTGDASDIIDEDFSPSDVTASTDRIGVTQDYVGDPAGSRDIVRFTTTDVLPDPLIVDTDYHVIKVDSSVIQVSETYDGAAIDLTDGGSGTHTITRQMTGEYNLRYSAYRTNTLIYQLPMAIDASGKAQPQALNSIYDTGEGGSAGVSTSYYSYPSQFLIRAQAKVEDYLYTVQESRVNSSMNMCRWKFNSVETSIALCDFGNSSTEVNKMVGPVGTKLYIGTNQGLFEYDTASPTTSPSIISPTSIIDSNIKDLAYDSSTEYLWSGHSTGLSKIDLTSGDATQYISGGGEELQDMSANEASIWPGQLDAYGGRIYRSGIYNAASYANYQNSWVMDDKPGGAEWCIVRNTTLAGCLRKDTTQVVTRRQNYIYLDNVETTGKGTGNVVNQENYFNGQTTDSYGIIAEVQLTKDHFFTFVRKSNDLYYDFYTVGSGFYYTDYDGLWSSEDYNDANKPYLYSMVRNLAPITDSTNGNINTIFWSMYWLGAAFAAQLGATVFGWDGSSWTIDTTASMPITKTGYVPVQDDLSIHFDNKAATAYNQQFVDGDQFTFTYGPMIQKDNLQTFDFTGRTYYCEAHSNTVVHTITDASGYSYVIDETSNPNFRDLDRYYLASKITYDGTIFDRSSSILYNSFTVNTANDVLTVGADVSTGTPFILSSSGTIPSPLLANGTIYYAVNMDSTAMRLAGDFPSAADSSYIDILTAGSGTHSLYTILPQDKFTYLNGTNGIFVFSPIDDSTTVSITYTYTLLP